MAVDTISQNPDIKTRRAEASTGWIPAIFRKTHENPELRRSTWTLGEPNSEKAHHLLPTEYCDSQLQVDRQDRGRTTRGRLQPPEERGEVRQWIARKHVGSLPASSASVRRRPRRSTRYSPDMESLPRRWDFPKGIASACDSLIVDGEKEQLQDLSAELTAVPDTIVESTMSPVCLP